MVIFEKSVTLSHENVQRVDLTLINSKILFLPMILSIKIEFIGRPIHAVSSHKEWCKILTSMFLKFSQIFDSFCSLFFEILTVFVLKSFKFFCTSFENDRF